MEAPMKKKRVRDIVGLACLYAQDADSSKVIPSTFPLFHPPFSCLQEARKDSYCDFLKLCPSINSNLFPLSRLPLLGPLAVSLGGVVTLVNNEVLGPVVLALGEVGFEDSLGAGGVARLGVERGTGHVRDGGVAGGAAPVLVGGGAERVVLGCGLGEPDVTTVAAKLAGGKSLGNILLDDDGTAGGVDEP